LSEQEIKRILQTYRVIAVIGLSTDFSKPSHEVSEYMNSHGYRIIPVNPFVEEVLGERSYKSLLEIPKEIQKTIEIVDIFRQPENVPPIVEQAVKLRRENGKPLVVWMQVGIINEEAARIARNAGMTVIMDKCLMVEHNRL
jgi:predicted CoA-binding protein